MLQCNAITKLLILVQNHRQIELGDQNKILDNQIHLESQVMNVSVSLEN